MNTRAGIAFLIALAICLMPNGASAAKKRSAARKPPTEAPWSPQPFPAGATTLPARYSGLSPIKTWALLKSRADTLVKGEYETSQEYEARLASEKTQIAPLSTDAEYAFLLANIKPIYDADKQTYSIQDYGFCQKTYDYGESAGWVTCKIAELTRKRDTYIGSNAYGAKAVIERTTGKDFGIAVRRDSAFLKSDVFDQKTISQYSSMFDLKFMANVPIDKAKSIAAYDIGVLLVGRIASPKLVEGRSVLIEPKITDPTDMFITQEAAPFSPSRLILFVVQTGEILSDHPL